MNVGAIQRTQSVTVSKVHRTFAARAAGTLLTFGFLLAASPAASSQPKVVVIATGTPTNSALSDVIAKAAEIQLQKQGLLTSTVLAESPRVTNDPARIHEIVGNDADFLLVIGYVEGGDGVAMNLTLVQMSDGMRLGRGEARVPLNLDLDRRVAQAVEALTEEPAVQTAIKAVAAKRTETHTAIAAVPKPLPAPEPQRVPTVAPAWGFAFSIDGAPIFVVGDASDYFHYGAEVSLFAGVRFPTKAWNLEAGASLGAAQLFPAAGPSQGSVYTLPEGVGIRFGSPPSLPVIVSAQASAGVAVIMVIPPGGELIAKTDAYAEGAVTGYVRLFGTLLLGVQIGTIVVFENIHPIVGLMPALVIRLAR